MNGGGRGGQRWGREGHPGFPTERAGAPEEARARRASPRLQSPGEPRFARAGSHSPRRPGPDHADVKCPLARCRPGTAVPCARPRTGGCDPGSPGRRAGTAGVSAAHGEPAGPGRGAHRAHPTRLAPGRLVPMITTGFAGSPGTLGTALPPRGPAPRPPVEPGIRRGLRTTAQSPPAGAAGVAVPARSTGPCTGLAAQTLSLDRWTTVSPEAAQGGGLACLRTACPSAACACLAAARAEPEFFGGGYPGCG